MQHHDDTAIGLEPGEGKNPATRLRNLYIIALGLIACLAIASQLVVQRALLRQESDAPVINIAGRQRMLSQKLAKAALTIDEILDHCIKGEEPPFAGCDELEPRLLDLRDVLDLWTRSHGGLQHGNTELDLPGANSPEVTALFEKIEPHYQAMREATESFLTFVEYAALETKDKAVAFEHLGTILFHEAAFLTGMNDIVFQYDAEAQARVSHLQRTELALMSIILIVLLLEALWVFAPAVRAIRRQFAQVRESAERLLDQQQRETEHVEIELEKVRGELVTRTRLATIGQVSASVAHELRNPLGAVRNAAYFLKRHVPQNEEKWAQYLGIIDEEVNRADRTIRNLMEMSRSKDPIVQQVDLADIVREARDLANAHQSVRCRMSFEVDPFLIHVDPSQLRQVLINLLTNAAQAISGRGEIVVVAGHENDYDRIVVRDSGPGVPTENRGQLFEPLFSTKAKGTGLGLTICRQIIERHGGTIEFVEVDEGGAAFEIRLPSHGAPESSESGEAICQQGKRSEKERRF